MWTIGLVENRWQSIRIRFKKNNAIELNDHQIIINNASTLYLLLFVQQKKKEYHFFGA